MVLIGYWLALVGSGWLLGVVGPSWLLLALGDFGWLLLALASSIDQQIPAYDINNIKFENGERQKVSNAILTMWYNHTTYYKKFGLDIGYEPI